ncbi:hypothetical protein CONLIGDRAFT_646722 [Coniochaeta ligniaria NRRL 30616]|uniref:Uncharacterized protein n=1 Tax=Coniochaeta ligniaria NRRL 30616 TaxID=1408157 RepID=A0A1J7JBG4_9PEZI|nr:hypothetical protein CONLIGDRAFT_646722 [Coniochaeta ligniaria NRRL 30616]
MSDLADQAQFARSQWGMAILIPFWTAQTAMLLGLMGIFSYRLAETTEHWDEMREAGDTPRVELVWEATNVAFSLLALVLTILEITKTAGEVLTPFSMLASHAIKLTLAFVNLALDIVVYLQRSDRNYSIVGLAIDCGLLVATLVPFIYSILTFRRLQKFEDYVPTSGVNHGADDYELGNNVQIFASGSPTGATKRASYLANDTSYSSQTTGLASPPLKVHVDRAVGTEFGWGWGNPTSGSVERSGSLVGMGVVRGRKSAAVESFEAVRRDSERGLVGIDEDGDGEDDDDDDGETVRGSHDGGRQVGVGHQMASEDDTHALLASQGHESGFGMPGFRDQVGRGGDGRV